MACYKIGAIAVPTNPLFTIPELARQFRDCGSESVIVMAPFADKVNQILKEGDTPVKRIHCRADVGRRDRTGGRSGGIGL